MPDYTVSADVDSMLRSANDAAIRSAIGVGTTDAPTFLNSTVVGLTSVFRAATGTGYSSDFGSGGLSLHSASQIAWSSTFTGFGTKSLVLEQDAAGILAQRNGSSPQAFRVANQVGALPLTDYDRAVFDFKTTLNTLRIGTENSGTTGYTTARPIEFVTGGVSRMSIGAAGGVIVEANLGIEFASNARIASQASGNIRLSNNSATDFGRLQLGGTTSAFPAIKRVATGIHIVSADESAFAPLTAGGITSGSYITVGSSNILGWVTGSGLFGNATSGAGTGALRFLFGGTSSQVNWGGDTNSFPAIKRSTTSLQARLADDSAFTNIQGKLTTDTAYTATVVTPTGFLTLYDSTGTAYRVPCVV